jgi:hypothetical protein
MMRHPFRALCFFLLLIISIPVHAQQSKTDSLEKLLQSTQGKERISLLRELANAYGSNDLQKALAYGKEGLELAQKSGDAAQQAAMLYEMGKSPSLFQ